MVVEPVNYLHIDPVYLSWVCKTCKGAGRVSVEVGVRYSRDLNAWIAEARRWFEMGTQ